MAELITLRSRPNKHILRRSLEIIRPNTIHSLASMAQRRALLKQSAHERDSSRAIVKDFLLHRAYAKDASYARGFERAERALAAEVLGMCINVAALHSVESLAEDQLACTIANNITNRPDFFTNSLAAQTSLTHRLRVIITATANDIAIANEELRALEACLDGCLTVTTSDETRGSLRIVIGGAPFLFGFHSRGLLRIVKSAITENRKD